MPLPGSSWKHEENPFTNEEKKEIPADPPLVTSADHFWSLGLFACRN